MLRSLVVLCLTILSVPALADTRVFVGTAGTFTVTADRDSRSLLWESQGRYFRITAMSEGALIQFSGQSIALRPTLSDQNGTVYQEGSTRTLGASYTGSTFTLELCGNEGSCTAIDFSVMPPDSATLEMTGPSGLHRVGLHRVQ